VSGDPIFRDVAANRSRAYWFVGQIFATRPDRPFLEDLRQRLAGSEDAMSGLQEMHAALDLPDLDAAAERLAREHLRLFGGLDNAKGPPPPYESVYREGRLMGATTQGVLADYADAGIGNPAPEVAPGDHIVAEFKFMALLCHNELSAWERNDRDAAETAWQRQHRFLHRHLLRWVPAYSRRLREEARELFYAESANVAERVLAEDQATLDDLMHAAGVLPDHSVAAMALRGS
jgi:TorA maturation chaperone TorD